MTMLRKELTTYHPVLRQSIITRAILFFLLVTSREKSPRSLLEFLVKESVSSPRCSDWWTWEVFDQHLHFVCKCEKRRAPLSFQKEPTSRAKNL